jgi:hypothetical protein
MNKKAGRGPDFCISASQNVPNTGGVRQITYVRT